MVRKVKDWTNSGSTIGRARRARDSDKLGCGGTRRWWQRLRRARGEELRMAGESNNSDVHDWEEKMRVRRRTV